MGRSLPRLSRSFSEAAWSEVGCPRYGDSDAPLKPGRTIVSISCDKKLDNHFDYLKNK